MTAETSDGALIRALGAGGAFRVIAVDATPTAAQTRRIHGLTGPAARLAAQGVAATALLSAHIKGDEVLTLQLQASAPRFAFFGEIDSDGGARARLTPARVPAWSTVQGIMLAIKTLGGRELYRGVTEVADETIEDALRKHFRTSAQVDGLLGLGAHLGADGVEFAGGLLVERLPAEAGKQSLTSEALAEQFGELVEGPDADVARLVASVRDGRLGTEPLEVLDTRDVRWQCRCSLERVESMLAALGVGELDAMIEEDHGAEVTCHFCGHAYTISEARLREIRQLLSDQSPAR